MTKWTIANVTAAASMYVTRGDFYKGNQNAYAAARRLGILDHLIPHTRKQWDVASVIKEATNYATKADFFRGSQTAYDAAIRLNLIDVLFDNVLPVNTRDCVYIWKAVTLSNVYKIGVTSESVGTHRIRRVAALAKVPYEVIVLTKVGSTAARIIERRIKRIGSNFSFPKRFCGSTEFRCFSPSELSECIEFISSHSIENIS